VGPEHARPQPGDLEPEAQGPDRVDRAGDDGEPPSAVRAGGGIWTLDDLAGYRLLEREPFRLVYRSARITTAPI
jgi:hypothetical protein